MKQESTNAAACGYNEFRRPNYFHGMLLDDKDFLTEQTYHDSKRRFVNRMLHGSGIVCGLKLTTDGTNLKLSSGLALDCHGNEIWVPKDQAFNVGDLQSEEGCGEREKGKEYTKDLEGETRHVFIHYKEAKTHPQPVYLPSSDCQERSCEYSRIKEGYCLEIRAGSSSKELKPEKDFSDGIIPCPSCGGANSCGECSGVFLGTITLGKDEVDDAACEYVLGGTMLKHLFRFLVSHQGPELQTSNPAKAFSTVLALVTNKEGKLNKQSIKEFFDVKPPAADALAADEKKKPVDKPK